MAAQNIFTNIKGVGDNEREAKAEVEPLKLGKNQWE